MLENTEKREAKLEVWSQLAPGENIAKIGEDLKKCTLIAKAGTRLNPYHIGLAAALGLANLKSPRNPKSAF